MVEPTPEGKGSKGKFNLVKYQHISMKEQHAKQVAGIWMDFHLALIITVADGDFAVKEKIKSDEYFGHKGEHGEQRADIRDARKFYKTIASHIQPFDEVLIFGPGKAQEELRNFLREDQHFKNKKISLDTASSLTDNQILAKVRDFFKE
jgi:stalled ribosome rescue protein Dom34